MIAILYPLKMDKNLSEAYSSIYESSASAGSSDGYYSDGGDGVFRSKEQVASHFNKNFPPKKNGKVDKRTRSAINTSARDFGIQGPTTTKDSYEPEGEVIEGKKYGMYKGDGKAKGAMKAYLDRKAAKLQKEKDNQKPEYKNNPAFGDPSHHSNKKMQYNSRYRKEWEEIKLMEMNEYRDSFEEWLNGLVEEGYDIERWDDADLIETFINESDLWDSKDAVIQAITESDKKGKGSGTKDACYHKVKSRYSVWPSAYASGALVKCRKKGAKNWGNSSKKEEVEYEEGNQLDELSNTTTANYLYHAKMDKGWVNSGRMPTNKQNKARNKGINRAEKKLGKEISSKISRDAKSDTDSGKRGGPEGGKFPRKYKVHSNKFKGPYAVKQEEVDIPRKKALMGDDFSDWRSDIQLNEILEKGTKGKVEFHSGRSAKENRQVMKTKRKTVNNPKGRKIHQSPMGKTIGKLSQVKSKQYDAEKKGDMKTASKMMDRRKKLSGTLYNKTGNFYDRADND